MRERKQITKSGERGKKLKEREKRGIINKGNGERGRREGRIQGEERGRGRERREGVMDARSERTKEEKEKERKEMGRGLRMLH